MNEDCRFDKDFFLSLIKINQSSTITPLYSSRPIAYVIWARPLLLHKFLVHLYPSFAVGKLVSVEAHCHKT